MSLTEDQHRRWVSNFFKSKVKEFDFFLRAVVECCDQSIYRFRNGQQSDEQAENRIVYAFSAFGNTVQSLKDAGSTFMTPRITWNDIDGLRHGKFIRLSRNAATHDGNPVITAWVDGHYFVPNNIHRLSPSGDLIEIPAPTVDAAQFCIEFAQDFSVFLVSRLSSLNSSAEGPLQDIDEIRKFLTSSVVPAFARQLFDEKQTQIKDALAQMKFDPIEDTITSLRTVAEFCESRLNT